MPPDPALERLDSYPYVHRVAEAMVTPVINVDPQCGLQDVVTRLRAQQLGSCLVVDDGGKVIGILTERDVLNAVGSVGAEALAQPVSVYMSAPVEWIAPDALLYRGIARMDRLRIRHLAVLDDEGKPLGMLTMRGLLRVRAGNSLAIGDAVERASDAAALRKAHDELPALARGLLKEGIAAADISAVISAITRDITARAAQLAQQEMRDGAQGEAPAAWCLMVLGSAGRGESLLAPDQDNALIVADDGAAEIDGWFLRFAERINVILNEAGIPFCQGNVMARNRAWRRTLGEWTSAIEHWTERPDGEALLNVDIFFDAAAVAGERGLADELMRHAHRSAQQALPFLRLLAEAGTAHRPPFTLLGGLKTDSNGRVDLKRGGLLPIVSGARVMALKLGLEAVGTSARLRAAVAAGRLGSDNAEGLEQARQAIAAAVLRQQIADCVADMEPGNRIEPRSLTRAQRTELKSALAAAAETATLVQDVLTS